MQNRSYYVYVLLENGTRPIYVGKGTRWRDTAHVWHAKKGTRRPLYNKIRAVLAEGGAVLAKRVAVHLTDAEAKEMEAQLIRMIGRKAHGGPLWNFTDGGDGCEGFRHTAESAQAMKDAWAKRKASGYTVSEETREKMRRSMKGYRPTLETRKKISATVAANHWNKGRKLPADQIAAIKAAVSRPVEIEGTRYPSISEAARALNLSDSTVWYRCSRGKSFPAWRTL